MEDFVTIEAFQFNSKVNVKRCDGVVRFAYQTTFKLGCDPMSDGRVCLHDKKGAELSGLG